MMSPPLTVVTQQFVIACVARGGGWDHSAMVETLEQLANIEIDQKSGHEEHG